MWLNRIMISVLALAASLFVVFTSIALFTGNRARLKLAIRYFLGVVFVLYGIENFYRLHPFDEPVSGDIHTLKSAALFWYFFGHSQAYINYVGFVEFAAGILIMIPRTFRIGTMAIAATAMNIAFLDFAYEVGPVRYWVSFLALLAMVSIALDWSPYRNALQSLTENATKG